MSAPDTSRDWVDGFAICLDARGYVAEAATLRALLAEREALARTLAAKEAAAQDALQQAWAERDAALRDAAAWKSAAHPAGRDREEERARAETAEAERDAARATVARLKDGLAFVEGYAESMVENNRGAVAGKTLLKAVRAALAEPTP